MASPRVQTSHGITAGLSIGDGTNNIKLECVPFIHDAFVKLTALARTTGKYAPNGKGWPDFAGHTNCAIFSRVGVTDGGGAVLRAEHAGTIPENELIILLKAKILQPAVSSSASVTRGGSDGAATNTSVTPAAGDKVSSLLADGKLLYQLDKLDEAETKLNQALSIQPDNQAAHYYLSVIRQQRIKAVVDAHNGGRLKVIPNPYVRTNTIHISAARQKLYEKLSEITFDKVSYPGLTLAEVMRNLRTETKQRDPGQEGINFVLNRAKPPVAGAIVQPGQPQNFDPTTGQPIVTPLTAAIDNVDLGTVMITLDPGLQNVRLMDVLEAIVKSSDHPIKYSLLDYGIEFSFKGPDVPELHTRTFKVDTNSFSQELKRLGAITNRTGSSTDASNIQVAIVNFFHATGVDLPAPKSVFFNDRQGTLTVHATADDLDLIEQAINTLIIAPPEVTIKVRFVEVDPGNKGMIALLGGILTNAPSTFTNSPTLCGILSQPRLKSILKALEKRDHANLLNEGEVTTLSGRQANFQVMDVKTIVTGLTTTTNNSTFKIDTTPFGTTVDVVPYVCADGYTVQMTVIPSVTEFLGYEDSGKFLKIDKRFKDAHLPLPESRIRKAVLSANVSDGQTLVLGNLSDELVVNELDGKELRTPFTDTKNKQLFVFITATIIDAAGNRVHSDDYYDGPVF